MIWLRGAQNTSKTGLLGPKNCPSTSRGSYPVTSLSDTRPSRQEVMLSFALIKGPFNLPRRDENCLVSFTSSLSLSLQRFHFQLHASQASWKVTFIFGWRKYSWGFYKHCLCTHVICNWLSSGTNMILCKIPLIVHILNSVQYQALLGQKSWHPWGFLGACCHFLLCC